MVYRRGTVPRLFPRHLYYRIQRIHFSTCTESATECALLPANLRFYYQVEGYSGESIIGNEKYYEDIPRCKGS